MRPRGHVVPPQFILTYAALTTEPPLTWSLMYHFRLDDGSSKAELQAGTDLSFSLGSTSEISLLGWTEAQHVPNFDCCRCRNSTLSVDYWKVLYYCD